MAKTAAALKRLVLGRPMASGELEHTLLPKTIALPVFSSDALSSVAYATQEMMLVLVIAGTGALTNMMPLAFAVATLLAIVIASYRQTVRAYPQGGGAYRVAHENIGKFPGLLAAGALLIDYVLTVSVSITAGTDAIVSAAPSVEGQKVWIAAAFVIFVALINLRGVKESGVFFAIPTYGFIACMYLMIGTGFVQCLGGCPQAASAGTDPGHAEALTLFLLLKSFAAGTTALTGVEAISDGVPAFRYPQSKNAATTLAIMGTISISMFLSVSFLANRLDIVHTHHSELTVLAEIGDTLFGKGLLFYVIQVMTAAILILAANTAFADFPRLASILAGDRYMPRQFLNRGDRLVFSNGIVILASFAILLIYVFDAELNKLIQLYLVGVFVSFTLSQAGMVARWRRLKTPGWRRSASINAIGAFFTSLVLVIVVLTKFKEGAWIVIAAIPVLIVMMRSINAHYTDVAAQLAHPERLPKERRQHHQHMVILIERVDAAAARAVGYARSVNPSDITAITFDPTAAGAWHRLAPEVELKALTKGVSRTSAIRAFLRDRRSELEEDDFLTFMVPEILKSRSLWEIFLRPRNHRMKASLRNEPGIQVLDIPLVRADIDASKDQAHIPARNNVIIMVSGVHNATLQAIEYAETLSATDISAVSFGLDPAATEQLGDQWLEARAPHPLVIEDSPFRDIGMSLVNFVRRMKPDGIDRVVTVVIPEFIVSRRRHNVLHGQTALIVKRRLLFETGVVVVSVPYPLLEPSRPKAARLPANPKS